MTENATAARTDWPLISVVVVSYNRAHLCRETLRTFRQNCTYPNLEFVICDNASRPEQRAQLLAIPADFYVVAGRNRSLGGNNNMGVRQARGAYVFYLQDDWACLTRGDWMQDALALLEAKPELGLVHLRTVPHITAYRTERATSGREVRLIEFEQPPGKYSHYVYNDGPQLKRRDFHEVVGWYDEDLPLGPTEDGFCRKFLAQRRYAIAAIDWSDDGHQLFEHIGDVESTRPDRWRNTWGHKLRQSKVGVGALAAYKALPEPVRRLTHKSFWTKKARRGR